MSLNLPSTSSFGEPVARAVISTERQNPAHELRLKQRQHQRARTPPPKKTKYIYRGHRYKNCQQYTRALRRRSEFLGDRRRLHGRPSPPSSTGRKTCDLGFAAFALLLVQHRTDYFLARLCDSSPTSTQRTQPAHLFSGTQVGRSSTRRSSTDVKTNTMIRTIATSTRTAVSRPRGEANNTT